MAVLATYISSTQFSIDGEHDQEYEGGRRIRLLQGLSGNVDVTTTVAAYDSGNDRTIITVTPAYVQAALTSIRRGASSANSVGHHSHTGHGDGGPLPSIALSATQISRLQDIADLVGDEGDVLQTDADNVVSLGQVNRYLDGTAGEALDEFSVGYLEFDGYDPLCYLAKTGGTDSQSDGWVLVAESGGIAESASGKLLQFGEIENDAWDWVPGRILWLDSLAGGMTDERPADNPKVQLGHALTATRIFFNPIGPVCTWNWRGAWTNGVYYANDDVVSHSSHVYIAKMSHTASTAADEPGAGAYWADIWELVI